MDEIIKGRVYVVGDDVDTDQIIPAQHLVYSLSDPEEKKLYGRYAFSGVPEDQAGLPQGHVRFVNKGEHLSPFTVIIAGRNFGCGSSREHAPIALEIAGVKAIVAESYARIFYRNVIGGAFFIPFETRRRLLGEVSTGDEVEIHLSPSTLANHTTGKTCSLAPLGDVIDILKAGGVFAYARKSGLLK